MISIDDIRDSVRSLREKKILLPSEQKDMSFLNENFKKTVVDLAKMLEASIFLLKYVVKTNDKKSVHYIFCTSSKNLIDAYFEIKNKAIKKTVVKKTKSPGNYNYRYDNKSKTLFTFDLIENKPKTLKNINDFEILLPIVIDPRSKDNIFEVANVINALLNK